jgi:hypothetical protein
VKFCLSHSGCNNFYPTIHSSYTRWIYKILIFLEINCLNKESKENNFFFLLCPAPHFISYSICPKIEDSGCNNFYPRFFSSYTGCFYKIVKICLSPTAGLTKHFTPYLSIVKAAVEERERERNSGCNNFYPTFCSSYTRCIKWSKIV